MKTSYPASVQSIERGLTLLEALSGENEGLGITELSRRTNLPASTVHRLLSVFVKRGYIARDDRGSSYRIDTKLLGLGFLPVSRFCEIYQMICKRFVDRMILGEVHEVFVRVASRSLTVRTGRQTDGPGSPVVPELTGGPPLICRELYSPPGQERCDRAERNGEGILFFIDVAEDSWCTCVTRGPTSEASGWRQIGAGGSPRLRWPEIATISSSLVTLGDEIRAAGVRGR